MWGALAGGASNLLDTGLQNIFSATEASKSRKWQQDMYQRRYQYTVSDLEAAGLNPILAITQGLAGTGVPSTSPARPTGKPESTMTSARTGALLKETARKLKVERGIAEKDSAIRTTEQEIKKADRDIREHDVDRAEAEKFTAQHNVTAAREMMLQSMIKTKSDAMDYQLKGFTVPGARALYELERDYPELVKGGRVWTLGGRPVLEMIGAVVGAAGLARILKGVYKGRPGRIGF